MEVHCFVITVDSLYNEQILETKTKLKFVAREELRGIDP